MEIMADFEMTNVSAGYYSEDQVLNDVSLSANRGQISVVLGPNGSGKSTTLRVLAGLLTPRSGRILLEGRDITSTPSHKRIEIGIGFLPQGRSVFPTLTVLENVEMGGWILRRDRKKKREAVEQALDRYPLLAEKRDQPAGSLSGGQQRLVEIARLLVSDPTVVLIDEPGAGLAPIFVTEVYEEIERLREENRAVLLVDQNVRKATEIADYIFTLELGSNQSDGPREQFINDLDGVVREWLRLK
jgi:branched-chain amino acid transport system ATP-binding protein